MQLIHEWRGRIFSSEHDFSSVQYDAIIKLLQDLTLTARVLRFSAIAIYKVQMLHSYKIQAKLIQVLCIILYTHFTLSMNSSTR